MDKKQIEDLNFLPKYILKVLICLIASKPFLHKLDKFYINLKTKDVTVKVNRKQHKIMSFEIDDDAFEGIKELIVGEHK